MAVKNLGRPRKQNSKIPAHINTTDLPEGLTYDNERLRWRFNYTDSLGKRHDKRVGSQTSTLTQILNNITKLNIEKPNTFNWLVNEYLKDARFLDLKPLPLRPLYCNCY